MAQKQSNKILLIDSFYGGIQKDDKSTVLGAGSNFEELDIFSNKDFIQAEQIMTATDTLPATSQLYAFTARSNDTVYGYGKETAGSKVRLFEVTTGGADNPGAWATLFTSADSTNLSTIISPIASHETTESGQKQNVYYIAGASSTWTLARYADISGTPAEGTVGTLTGLTGSFDRPSMRRIFGELFVCNGQFIAKVDSAAVFTEKAFTLPNGWEAVDIVGVGDAAMILCRNQNRFVNQSAIYVWDLDSTTGFDESIFIPMGGPQWIANHKEAIRVCCAVNGVMRLYQLSGAFPLETHTMTNIAAETTTQPISPTKSVTQKDGILYFGLYKTDKSGIYALGQVDEDKPLALVLSKRFDTSDYSLHKPIALHTQGPNFYAAFDDNGTPDTSRCESNNSPTRSSNAVYETIWIDDGTPYRQKQLNKILVNTKPLSASTSLTFSIRADFGSSYTTITRGDGTNYATENDVFGQIQASTQGRAFQIKVAFTSSTTNSPKLQTLGLWLEDKVLT